MGFGQVKNEKKFAVGISPALFIEKHIGGFVQYDFDKRISLLLEDSHTEKRDPQIAYIGNKLVLQPKYFVKIDGVKVLF